MLKGVPQLAALGPVFKTCPPVQVRRAELGVVAVVALSANWASCAGNCQLIASLPSGADLPNSIMNQFHALPLHNPAQLTEEETEYKVVCVRHVLDSHLVLQFNCTNTVKEQVGRGTRSQGSCSCRPVGLDIGRRQYKAAVVWRHAAGAGWPAGLRAASQLTATGLQVARTSLAHLSAGAPFSLHRCWSM